MYNHDQVRTWYSMACLNAAPLLIDMGSVSGDDPLKKAIRRVQLLPGAFGKELEGRVTSSRPPPPADPVSQT
jgi:hypothetical protein